MRLKQQVILLMAGLTCSAFASTQDEINHLLEFVASTQCQYERNGERHDGSEAVTHIKRKYDYYADEVETAEDFIQYAATKSALSGRYYQVHCANKDPMKSHDWLLIELSHYRSTQ